MMNKIKMKLRHLWTYFVFGFGLCVAFAAAPAQAQTYVRPSKGMPFVAFDLANTYVGANSLPSGADSTYTSAAYDTSAFAEFQLESTTTHVTYNPPVPGPITVTTKSSWGVSRLGRYVRLRIVVTNGSQDKAADVYVETSDNPGTGYTLADSTESSQRLSAAPNTPILSLKLVVTPLPYNTTTYTRPQKGIPIVVFNKNVITDGSLASPEIDMRGFASLMVEVESKFTIGFSNACTKNLKINITGGTTNKVRDLNQSDRYVANITGDRAKISVSSYPFPGMSNTSPMNCSYKVKVTPLPYAVVEPDVSTSAYGTILSLASSGVRLQVPTTLSRFSSPSGTDDSVPYGGGNPYTRMRLQNTSVGAIGCGLTETGTNNNFVLAAETVAGNGGVVDLNSYGSNLFCGALGGVAAQLSILSW